MPASRTMGAEVLNALTRRLSPRANRAIQLKLNEYFDALEDDIDQVEVAITLAEMHAIETTPKLIVAPPGADKFLEFVSAIIIYQYGTTQFTVAGDSDFVLQYVTSNAAVSTTLETTGMLDQTNDEIRNLTALSGVVIPVNEGIELINTGTSLSSGVLNEVRVICTYRTHNANLV